MQQKISQQVNLLLLGAPKAGKTSISKQLVYSRFDLGYQPTIAVDIYARFICFQTDIFKVSLWDASSAKHYRFLTHTYLQDKNLNGIGFVFDGSVPLEEATILDWLGFVLEQTITVPLFFLFNKLDLIEQANRIQQEALLIQKLQTILAQKILNDLKVSIHFCSAKTGEGIQATFDTLLADIHAAEQKKIKHKLDLALLAAEPKPSLLQQLDLSWSEFASKLLASKWWMGGNLFIFLLTIALFIVTLLPVIGSLSVIGILPAWAMCVVLGGLVLLGWNIGCVFYYYDYIPPQKTAQDHAEIKDVSEKTDNFACKETEIIFHPVLFRSERTAPISYPVTQALPAHTVYQTPPRLGFL